ncbi:MAG: alpha-L-fucosidase [Bacteroidetes bacterium GWF2_42_66]|nr:MAG: alpha-L-fucosidase [Bacteroidetes bacterium GWA2_42_15]OFX98119.1 MAG: alpha-L-fucosidase [Bacteroidetes bacterium GWE2_42_39]OFY42503.1 MAG: alpha-L-fucosidase [Bacteroidetes bacterium GWF2_42_66]HBL74218.1 alpha-L-fucosidase [Prolixibacteraceae bacterium]HCU63987.1 alpha-L-fucosidase [Prolixibacteraceae bacterium]
MRVIILLSIFTILLYSSSAQEGYQPTPENLQRREWYQDARFGLYIHWGLYSIMAGGGDQGVAEWIMNNKKIPIKQYEKLAGFFNPTGFDPAEWVTMAKKAGMKYIIITSKHHDGFAMYDSEVSGYNIVDQTPYGKDIIKKLKDECDKQGIMLAFYYSQLDWHHPDYYPRGGTGQKYTGRPESGDWYKYLDYMDAQLTELLTNYGDILGIWFDGMWDNRGADWRLGKTYSLIHKLQPASLISSNHKRAPFPGEDMQKFERDLPGENTMGFSKGQPVSELPLEVVETMNGSWGFNINDQDYKSPKQLIQTMVKAAGYGANFVVNTGPMPNGKIQPENVKTLMEMGKWMEKYGETIYETRKGPIGPKKWGATTKKGDKVFVHILDLEDENLLIPNLPEKIKSIKFFDGGDNVNYKVSDYGTLLNIPKEKQNDINTILVVELTK